MYIDNVLIYTSVLKDQSQMDSGRHIYQVLLVKNIFQRNFPEIRRLKTKLQKHIEMMTESEHVTELITDKEL